MLSAVKPNIRHEVDDENDEEEKVEWKERGTYFVAPLGHSLWSCLSLSVANYCVECSKDEPSCQQEQHEHDPNISLKVPGNSDTKDLLNNELLEWKAN